MVCTKLFSLRQRFFHFIWTIEGKNFVFFAKEKCPHLYRTFDNGFYKVLIKNCKKLFRQLRKKKKAWPNQTFFCKFTIFVGCIFNVLWSIGLTRGICFFIWEISAFYRYIFSFARNSGERRDSTSCWYLNVRE